MEPVRNDNSSSRRAETAQERARRDAIKGDASRGERTAQFQRMMGDIERDPKTAPRPFEPLEASDSKSPADAEPAADADADAELQGYGPGFDNEVVLSKSAAQFLGEMSGPGRPSSSDSLPESDTSPTPAHLAAQSGPPASGSRDLIRRRAEADQSPASTSDQDDASSEALSSGLPTASAPPPRNPAAAAGAGRSITIPPDVQRFVEYAAITRNAQGCVEFFLGLNQGVLGGVGIRISAYGNRRVGVRVTTGGRNGAADDPDFESLVQTLRQRGIEVVETVFD
jgi:hypothetical protein